MKHIYTLFILILQFSFLSVISAQSTRDTLYPGVDLQILKMEALKKEVIQGEGIAVQLTVMNLGITTSESTRIDFWVSDSDEAMLTQDDVNSSKIIMPLKQDTKLISLNSLSSRRSTKVNSYILLQLLIRIQEMALILHQTITINSWVSK